MAKSSIGLSWTVRTFYGMICKVYDRYRNFSTNQLVVLTSQKLRISRQHGTYSVYEHSIYVCQTALKLSDFLHLKINRNSLTKAALLHDYFLYDWHDKETEVARFSSR